MTFTINNGRRADVEFGPHKGRSGISEDGGEVAFFAKLKDFAGVTSGTIGDVPHVVTGARKSDTVDGMIVLTVQAVTAGPGE